MQGLKQHLLQNFRFILEIIVPFLEQPSKCKKAINLLSTHFPYLQGDILATDILQFCQPAIKRETQTSQFASVLLNTRQYSGQVKTRAKFSVLPAGEVRRDSGGKQQSCSEGAGGAVSRGPCWAALPTSSECTGSICSWHGVTHLFYWVPLAQHKTVQRDNPVKRPFC